jgi:hypothetical protein
VSISARQLNRATLARQGLLRREPAGSAEVVRRLVALQAQEPASPYLALWNRIEGFDAAELDAVLTDGTLVKATLLRLTLHLVHADDHPELHAAMQPTLRAARLGDRRFTDTGLTAADADALLPDVVAFVSEPRTNAEVEAYLRDRLAERSDEELGEQAAARAWWALRSYGPFRHAVTDGPWSFGRRPAYVAAGTAPVDGDPDAHLPALVRRYLGAFGPATVADVAQFALVQRARVRAAVAELGDELERLVGPGGLELLDVPGGELPDEDVPAPPRLLPMWESTLLAYADRSRVLPEPYRPVVTRRNGDVLPTVLVDGEVAGIWRAVEGGVEVSAFEPLPAAVWDDLAEAASALTAFLADRDPAVYARFHHWWEKPLTTAEVRVLPG